MTWTYHPCPRCGATDRVCEIDGGCRPLYCWDCGADMVPMPETTSYARMVCTGCGLNAPREITERMNVRRAGEIADMRHGTPCIVCGAPILQGVGHDNGCALEWQNTAHLTPAVPDPCHPPADA